MLSTALTVMPSIVCVRNSWCGPCRQLTPVLEQMVVHVAVWMLARVLQS